MEREVTERDVHIASRVRSRSPYIGYLVPMPATSVVRLVPRGGAIKTSAPGGTRTRELNSR